MTSSSSGAHRAGLPARLRAAREGLRVLLVQHNRHIGGMLTNGLMQWDSLYGGPRSPIFNEYAGMIAGYYRDAYGEHSSQYQQARYSQKHYPMSRFEPRVAERLFNDLVSAEKNITTLLSHYPSAIERDGAVLKTLALRNYGTTQEIAVVAATYVDATYEGDLAALAKVPYRVGREGHHEHREPHAGKIFTNISAKSGPQDAKNGKLNLHLYNHIQGTIDPNSPRTADRAVQAYNYRFCLTNEENNHRLPDKPIGYKREEYVGYYRLGNERRQAQRQSPVQLRLTARREPRVPRGRLACARENHRAPQELRLGTDVVSAERRIRQPGVTRGLSPHRPAARRVPRQQQHPV